LGVVPVELRGKEGVRQGRKKLGMREGGIRRGGGWKGEGYSGVK